MKRFTLIIITISILSSFCVHGQIVLEPEVTGSIRRHYTYGVCWTHYSYHPHTTSNRNTVSALQAYSDGFYSFTTGLHGWWDRNISILASRGVIEVRVTQTASGGLIPTESMTPFNWNAVLSGLTLNTVGAPGTDLIVDLYDLQDHYENGQLEISEYFGEANTIANLFSVIPPAGTRFEVDVTDALRRDIFGEGIGDVTSGFMIVSGFGDHFVRFNPDNPRVKITLGTPNIPTQTPVPTNTPTMTPIPTFTPCPGVDVYLNQKRFTGGDPFKLRAFCTSPPGMSQADLFVLLDVYSQYWFWPEWTETMSSHRIELVPNITKPVFVLDFTWPEGDYGSADGLLFHGVLTKPDSFDLIGAFDSVVFGYD